MLDFTLLYPYLCGAGSQIASFRDRGLSEAWTWTTLIGLVTPCTLVQSNDENNNLLGTPSRRMASTKAPEVAIAYVFDSSVDLANEWGRVQPTSSGQYMQHFVARLREGHPDLQTVCFSDTHATQSDRAAML